MTTRYRNDPLPDAVSARPRRVDDADKEVYLPDEGLVAAVNVALMLGRPLLLTGEPGCGKTRLAYHLAGELQLGHPLRFDTKSDSAARDLFYRYDAIAHFHAAQVNKDPDPLPHLRLNALGAAVLATWQPKELEQQGLSSLLQNKELANAIEKHPRQSLVLIDEIDKASRDFPNDILNEVENLCFRIPELGKGSRLISVSDDLSLRPILILTSNSEKGLPDAFLRRCIYYDIKFPNKERLRKIISAHFSTHEPAYWARFQDVLAFFEQLRLTETGLKRRPGTAELLDWLRVLAETLADGESPTARSATVEAGFSALIKNREDHQLVVELWRQRRQSLGDDDAGPRQD